MDFVKPLLQFGAKRCNEYRNRDIKIKRIYVISAQTFAFCFSARHEKEIVFSAKATHMNRMEGTNSNKAPIVCNGVGYNYDPFNASILNLRHTSLIEYYLHSGS